MRGAASTLGFAFAEHGSVEEMTAPAALPLFGRGRAKRVSNVLTRGSGDEEVAIFDYQYTTGGGRESRTWRQTIALFPRGAGGVPDFVLAPEHLVHKIGQAFGYQDIDFDSHPDFSTRYLLRGSDEQAIRRAFAPAALSYLEQHVGWTVEVRGETAAVYRAGKRVAPEDLPTFLEDTRAMLRALAR
jgi:hypothetical protein